MRLAIALVVLVLLTSIPATTQTRPRGRDLGIPFPGQTGPANAITDVAGIAVGHVTLIEGEGKLVPGKGPIRTGVTAILPRPRGNWDPVFAATFNQNGNGDMTGINWIKESGFMEGPILLTGTHSVGTVRDAAIQWQLKNGRDFVFTYLHGIAWAHVENKPTFGELWRDIARKLEGVNFVAAHNASFDRSVLRACCETAAVVPLKLSFVCTVRAARSIWGFYPTTLADVCRQLRIPLRHHDAESDAQACARILLAARQLGHEYHHVLKTCALKAPRR